MAVVVAEIVLRLFGLAPTDGVATVTESEFNSLPGIFARNQRIVDRRNRNLPHHVSIDSLGYRGFDFPRTKPAGERRILFTGDSFAYGEFVEDTATLPAQLEARLRLRCGGAVRVINAGVGGTTIVDAAMMVDRGLALKPDLVILLFSENDIADLAQAPLWERLAQNRRAKSRFPLSIVYPMLRRTALWNFGLHVVGTVRARGAPAMDDLTGGDAAVTQLRARYRSVLRVLRDSLAAGGSPLVLVTYPSHHALAEPGLREQMTWVTESARADGIPVVDLLPALAGTGLPREELYLLPHDGHPNARGYMTAADALAAALVSGEQAGAICPDSTVGAPGVARR